MKYILSPEFHRQLWLRFNAVKILAVPFLLLLIVEVLTPEGTPVFRVLRSAAEMGFCATALLGGIYQASQALQEEIKNRTWDGQKMSSITPARLAFGKFFGATSYLWYGALVVLCIFIYAALNDTPDLPYRRVNAATLSAMLAASAPAAVLFSAFSMVMAALIGQAVAFLSSLSDATAAQNRLGRLYTPSSIAPFFAGIVAAYAALSLSEINVFSGRHAVVAKTGTTGWFGWDFDPKLFCIATLLFFFGWLMTGIYRITQKELMYPQTPVCWVGAVWTISIYVAGLAAAGHGYYFSNLPGFLFGCFLVITYISLFQEAADIGLYERFIAAWRQKKTLALLRNTPRWVSTAVFLPLFYVMALVFMAPHAPLLATISLMTSALLFAARDGIVVHGIHMGSAQRNVRFYFTLYFIVAYILLPAFYFMVVKTGSSGGSALSLFVGNAWGQGHEETNNAAMFFPTAQDNVLISVMPAALEVVFAVGWLRMRRKRALAAA